MAFFVLIGKVVERSICFRCRADHRISDELKNLVGFVLSARALCDLTAEDVYGISARDLARLMTAHTVADDKKRRCPIPDGFTTKTILIHLTPHTDVAFSEKRHM